MIDKIVSETILTVVGLFVTGTLGYLAGRVRDYKKRDKTQEEALKCLLRSSITSKYYVYSELKEIPRYEKENIDYMYEQYKKMGGNSYVSMIVEEINKLPIKK